MTDEIGAVKATAERFGVGGSCDLPIARIEHDEVHCDNARFAALFAALLVFPGIGLKTAGDENLAAKLKILTGNIRHAAPCGDRMIGDTGEIFAGIGCKCVRRCDVEIGNTRATGSLANRNRLRDVANELYAVKREHDLWEKWN